jgi:hypothetical protein
VSLKRSKRATISALPVWQSALLNCGCKVWAGAKFRSIELLPAGEHIVCTPTISGWMSPFEVPVKAGQTLNIAWNQEISRYVVSVAGERRVA